MIALTASLVVFSMLGLGWGLHKCDDYKKVNYTASVAEVERLKSADVMICSILKNEQLYIDEWLHYHKFLGFDRVQLYDNADSASLYIASLPEKYGNFVNVTHYPGLGKQRTAYKDCMEKNSQHNMWAAFLDIDEFIVLRKHANIKEFLHDLAPGGGSVVLAWSLFGSNNTLTRTPGPVVARFTLTSVVPVLHTKAIVYLKHAKKPDIHNTEMLPGYPTIDQHRRPVNDKSPFVCNNSREIAYINHYYTKSFEEFRLKRQRGWASNFIENHLVTGQGQEAYERIMKDYNKHNLHSNEVEDTFVRDFYLKHFLGQVQNATFL
eukprot:gene13235-15252_t